MFVYACICESEWVIVIEWIEEFFGGWSFVIQTCTDRLKIFEYLFDVKKGNQIDFP